MRTGLIISLLGLAFLLPILIGIGLARRDERRAWNGGRCPKCKTRWRPYRTDERGRGYECPRCDKIIWITFHVDQEPPC